MQLKVAREDLFFRGMPVINSAGSVVAIIMEGQVNSNNVLFQAVDMAAIQQRLDKFKQCAYFQLVELGQSGTPCDVARKTNEIQKKEAKIVARNNKAQPIALGMSFGLHYSMSASGVENKGLGAFGLSAGMDVYISPDKGRIRPTIKPRINYSPLAAGTDFPAESSVGFKPKTFRVIQLESPVMIEFVTKRMNAYMNSYLSIGYIPAYQFPLKYKYTIANNESTQKDIQDGAKGYKHKLGAEIGMEGASIRFSFNIRYQLSPWDDPGYTKNINNYTIYPANHSGGGFFQFGIEVASRLTGRWGLKSK